MTDVATYILVRFIGQSLIKNMLPLFFVKNLLKVRTFKISDVKMC